MKEARKTESLVNGETVDSTSIRRPFSKRSFWIGFVSAWGVALFLSLCAFLISITFRSSDTWNSNAITATPVSHEVFSMYPIPNDPNSIKWPEANATFVFDLRNNTNSDYRLDAPQKGSVTVMLRLANGALIDGKGVYWNLVGAGQEAPLSNVVSTGNKEPDNILIPRSQTVRLVVSIDFSYTSKPQPTEQEMEQYATQQIKDAAGFVLLDSVRRVQINLPFRK